MLKVGFLGNCQAQSMEGWVRQLPDEIDVVSFPPVWLVEPSQVGETVSNIEASDFVFAQRISDDFELPELATSRLKAQYGDKIVSWPNAYFDGYFPGISYRYSGGERVLGPLDEYHWDIIERSHANGLSVGDCVRLLITDRIFDYYPDPVSHSMLNLAEREAGLDVIVSDYVAAYLHRDRLFYSMNHPVNGLMREIMERLFGEIGERRRLRGLGEYAYPLNKIILPILPAIAEKIGIQFTQDASIKGVEVRFDGIGYEATNLAKDYTIEELVACFYRLYDINIPLNDASL